MNKYRASDGYIYLICDSSNDSFKIGVTSDICTKRMKKLQTGNSTELHICDTYKCKYPYRLEKMLHDYFSDKHILNEWFRLDAKDVANFKSICIMLNNRITALMDNEFFMKNIH